MTSEIIQYNGGALMPAMTLQNAVDRYKATLAFTSQIMVEGRDYGKIPGAGDKPTLLKPGAEKLCSFFGLAPEFKSVDKMIDFERDLFYIQYECRLYHRGELVGSGVGSCNSQEKKYRYRQSERVCPACGKSTIIKGKAEYGGGWLCFAKKGGCGAKYAETDTRITDQQVGQIENPDKADLLNTIDKMAQKRALVAAVLITANASEYYTQDIEDMAIDASFRETLPATPPVPEPEPPTNDQPSTPAPVAPRAPKPGAKPNIPQLLIDAGLAENMFEASGMLNKAPNAVRNDSGKALAWSTVYREQRNAGKTPEEAAAQAVGVLEGGAA